MSLQARSFNLKTLVYIFIVIDTAIIATFNWIVLIILLTAEVSVIYGYQAGIRREGQFKSIMYDLTRIATNKKLTDEEKLHQLVMGIHHHNLEMSYIFEKLNRMYGFEFTKKTPYINNKIKKTKKKRGVTIKMDSEYWKRIGYTLAVLWALWGLPLLDLVLVLELKPLWVIFIVGGWETLDGLIWWLLKFYFGVEKEEVTNPETSPETTSPSLPEVLTNIGTENKIDYS